MLTTAERQKLTQHMAKLKPEARVAHIAQLRTLPGKAAEVAVLEGIHRQLCEIEQAYYARRAAAVPLEVNGQFRQTATAEPRIEYPPYWTPERVKYAALSAAGIAGAGAGIYYVVIPATIAAVSAVVSVVSVVAPYVAGLTLAVIFLREVFMGGASAGEKKTDNYPAPNPRNSGGNVYNVYVGEGQVHVHQNGEK